MQTSSATDAFIVPLAGWLDESDEVLPGGPLAQHVCRVDTKLVLSWGDEYTRHAFELRRHNLIAANKGRDAHYRYSDSLSLPHFVAQRMCLPEGQAALPACIGVGWFRLWDFAPR